jgi:hypothetical protein
MTAALVGWYVELAKLEPAFAAPGEHPEEALARVKPVLVVLLDSEFEEARSDLLALRAAKRGIGLAIFGTERSDEAVREWARRTHSLFFELPVDLEAFGRVLDQAVRQATTERRGREDRRVGAQVDRALDGTLLLLDNHGVAWYVYDRRGSDRRSGAALLRPYRAFVSADGIERRCELNDREFSARGPDALIAQLSRAAQVPANHS